MPKKKLKLTDERSYYKPFSYPWAFDAFKSSEQMHWLWTEVPMLEDVKDWKNTLSKSEKDFLTHIFRFFTQADIENLMKNTGIIRNKGKIKAIIQNAQNFLAIQKHFISFQKYLDSLDKSDNYANAIKDLVNKFKWLGPPSASLFLYTVGEKIQPW